MRWVLLAAWIVLVVFTVLLGEREGRFGDLEKDLAAGKVTEVSVSGEMPGEQQSEQTVHWRDGLFRRTDVIMTYSGGERPGFHGTIVQAPNAVTYLQQQYPGVTVRSVGERQATSDFYGFGNMSPALGILYAVVYFGTLLRIIAGPQPWRATRWAWFWVWCFLAPVAPPLFLTLAGPTPLVPAPKNLNRRLTGGWALLLVAFVSAVLGGTALSF
ncbi:hypothetical protein GCM10022223_05060 [Kineosporia mesophila]|uniref:DUF3592 domain-containing protein n=1 Tax=Kineosporia mesophila TaxID=566012 RepID=A0ABP6YWT0_9ACTN|nr:hypothetical protein [Kineosporia mesophila]MCD5354283.1 hypothetical protein [Kineosporia mesophila]